MPQTEWSAESLGTFVRAKGMKEKKAGNSRKDAKNTKAESGDLWRIIVELLAHDLNKRQKSFLNSREFRLALLVLSSSLGVLCAFA